MRILVTGGRDYTDRRRIYEALDTIHANRAITEVIHGDCRGADRLAASWAKQRGIPDDPHPADWDDIDAPGAIIRRDRETKKFYNAAAGHQRNLKMLALEPDLVVAFPGGPGTAHCVANALKRLIAVMSVDA
jgi:acetylornithine deacetylase/succinyl-diaminopimelate desuccinylase-like protein